MQGHGRGDREAPAARRLRAPLQHRARRPTACPAPRARSSRAASGWPTTTRSPAASTKPRRCSSGCSALRNHLGLLSEEYEPDAAAPDRQLPAGVLAPGAHHHGAHHRCDETTRSGAAAAARRRAGRDHPLTACRGARGLRSALDRGASALTLGRHVHRPQRRGRPPQHRVSLGRRRVPRLHVFPQRGSAGRARQPVRAHGLRAGEGVHAAGRRQARRRLAPPPRLRDGHARLGGRGRPPRQRGARGRHRPRRRAVDDGRRRHLPRGVPRGGVHPPRRAHAHDAAVGEPAPQGQARRARLPAHHQGRHSRRGAAQGRPGARHRRRATTARAGRRTRSRR